MGPSLNEAGSCLGESSSLNEPGVSLTGIRPEFPQDELFTVAYAAILKFSLCPPLNRPELGLSFAQIKPRFPARGLFPSAIVHAAILIVSLFPPLFNLLTPPRIIEVREDDLRPIPPHSLVMTELSYSARIALEHLPTTIPSTEKGSNPSSPHRTDKIPTPPAPREETATAPSNYSGPQEIVSISPNSTNSIQTILRPDLVNPPPLKFPQLLKPVVILPSSGPAASDIKPASLVALPVSAHALKETPVEMTKVPSSASLPAPEMQHEPLPQIEPAVPPTVPPAAIVLNAVTVPENAPAVVPPAELHGSFAVRPLRSLQSSAGAGASGESTPSSDTTKTADALAQRESGEAVALSSATPTPKRASSPNATGNNGNTTGKLDPNRSGPVSGAFQGADHGVRSQSARGVPGITIIGGTSRGGSGIDPTTGMPAKYGLTVISSGTSGGASRDLGVFDRSETVYTVYIPMADAGGGPDWSIQYAILDPLQAGSGLLTAPVAVKKVRAIVTGESPDGGPSTIFFSAVISAKGELTVKLPRQMDARARQALDALCQWEFLPAQLNGVAVGIKVLVGVGTISQ